MSWPVGRSLVVCPNRRCQVKETNQRLVQGYYRVDTMCRLDHHRPVASCSSFDAKAFAKALPRYPYH